MLSGEIWPAHPHPLPDEILSSWTLRVAAANGVRLQPLLDVVPERVITLEPGCRLEGAAVVDHGVQPAYVKLLGYLSHDAGDLSHASLSAPAVHRSASLDFAGETPRYATDGFRAAILYGMPCDR